MLNTLKKHLNLNPFLKSILLNCIMLLVLLIISVYFFNITNIIIALGFLSISIIIISINVLNFYQIFSDKEKLTLKQCLILGFAVGAVTSFSICLFVISPSLMLSLNNNNTNNSDLIIIFMLLLPIYSVTGVGCLTAAISTAVSPLFTKNKLTAKYFISWLGLLFLFILQSALFLIFVFIPIFHNIITEKTLF